MCVWKARIEYFINDLLWPTTIWKINTNNTRREKQLGKESASTERKRSLCIPVLFRSTTKRKLCPIRKTTTAPLHQYRQRQSNRRLTSTCCTISTPPSQAYPYRRSSLFLLLYTSSTLRGCRERSAGLSCLAGRMERRAGARQDVRRIGRKDPRRQSGIPGSLFRHFGGQEHASVLRAAGLRLIATTRILQKRKSKYRRSMPASGSWKRMKHTGGNSNNYLPCNKPPGMLWKMPKHR